MTEIDAPMNVYEVREMLLWASAIVHDEEQPKRIRAAKSLDKTVLQICKARHVTPTARAQTAVGLIRDRVCEAYKVDDA